MRFRNPLATIAIALAVVTIPPAVSWPTIQALGRTWWVKDIPGGTTALPGPNLWKGALVQADGAGLHLAIDRVDGAWASAEVWLTENLGFGTYLFRFSSSPNLDDALDKHATLGLFLWDDESPDSPGVAYREADIEVSRWGNEVAWDPTGAQFVLQPFTTPGNIFRFPLKGASSMTCVHQWYATLLKWACWSGLYGLGNLPTGTAPNLLAAWKYPDNARVPPPGIARVHLNLWMNNPVLAKGQPVRVTINGFEHTSAWQPLVGVPDSFPPNAVRKLATIDGEEVKVARKSGPDVEPAPHGGAEAPVTRPGPAAPSLSLPASLNAVAALLVGAEADGRITPLDATVATGILELLRVSHPSLSHTPGGAQLHGDASVSAAQASASGTPHPAPSVEAQPATGSASGTHLEAQLVTWLLDLPLERPPSVGETNGTPYRLGHALFSPPLSGAVPPSPSPSPVHDRHDSKTGAASHEAHPGTATGGGAPPSPTAAPASGAEPTPSLHEERPPAAMPPAAVTSTSPTPGGTAASPESEPATAAEGGGPRSLGSVEGVRPATAPRDVDTEGDLASMKSLMRTFGAVALATGFVMSALAIRSGLKKIIKHHPAPSQVVKVGKSVSGARPAGRRDSIDSAVTPVPEAEDEREEGDEDSQGRPLLDAGRGQRGRLPPRHPPATGGLPSKAGGGASDVDPSSSRAASGATSPAMPPAPRSAQSTGSAGSRGDAASRLGEAGSAQFPLQG